MQSAVGVLRVEMSLTVFRFFSSLGARDYASASFVSSGMVEAGVSRHTLNACSDIIVFQDVNVAYVARNITNPRTHKAFKNFFLILSKSVLHICRVCRRRGAPFFSAAATRTLLVSRRQQAFASRMPQNGHSSAASTRPKKPRSPSPC